VNITSVVALNHNWINACSLERLWPVRKKEQLESSSSSSSSCIGECGFLPHEMYLLRRETAEYGGGYTDLDPELFHTLVLNSARINVPILKKLLESELNAEKRLLLKEEEGEEEEEEEFLSWSIEKIEQTLKDVIAWESENQF